MELAQISSPVLTTMLAAVLIGVIGSVAAVWITSVKLKARIAAVTLGITGYIIADLFLRSWFMQAVSADNLRTRELLYQLVLALTIVLFEELVRCFITAVILKNKATDENAITFGVSWGAVECRISLGLIYMSYYLSAKTINAGNFEILSESELADLKIASEYLSYVSPLSVILDVIKAAAGVVMQVFYTFVIMRGVANKTLPFCIALTAIVHFLYIYIPTLLILLPAGLIISALFCSLCATMLIYYMREAFRRAKFYADPRNQI